MMNLNMRKPLLNMTLHPCPDYGFAVAPSLKSAPPASCDLKAKARQGLLIFGNSVVSVVPANHRTQPLSLVRDWVVHPFSHLSFKLMKFCLHLLPNRKPANCVHSVAALSRTDMRKTQEVKCFRFTRSSFLSVVDRKWTKFQNPRLLGMKFKTEFEHALFEFIQKLFGLRFMFKTHNKVISPPDDHHLATRLVPLPLLCPKIQDVVKIDVCKQRTDRSSLRNTIVRLFPFSIDHDTRLEPFLDQADHSRILNSMFDKSDQPFVAEVIEKSSDVGIQNPVHSFCSKTDVQNIQAVVLPFTRSVPKRGIEEVTFVDRIQNLNRTSLDDLILQDRYPPGDAASRRLWL